MADDTQYTSTDLAYRFTQAMLEDAIAIRQKSEKAARKREERNRKHEARKRRRHKIAIEALADVAEGGGDLSRVEAAKCLLET
jgi:CRISPR/Cas system-associated protein Cas7 (RAMP superfamily)